jgi:phosphoribosylaminoimidazole-succinocarboxamide synthase
MPALSPIRENWPLLPGLKLLNRGKVRDLYLLPCGFLLMVATDAISIFDFVLNALIPQKGIILTAISVFWFKTLEKFGIKHHMVAFGSGIDEYLPEELRGNVDLQSRALVVKNLDMVDDREFIVRGCLTGSGLEKYDETGVVCGHVLPKGLQDGDKLPFPLDTPSSKAKVGHDEHVDAAETQAKYPLQTYLALRIFAIMAMIAEKVGIVLADAKFEFAKNGTLADEIGTPDSSRFWAWLEWIASRAVATGRKACTSMDKEFARTWGKIMGINDKKKFDPKKPEDVAKVHAMVVPAEVIRKTWLIYRYIFWRLTGHTIERYLRAVMHVNVPMPDARRVLVICGSKTDLPQVQRVCEEYTADQLGIQVDVMSCHRNPLELMEFAEQLQAKKWDMLVCTGAKWLELPGDTAAWMNFYEKDIRVAGVALGKPGTEARLAAVLAIKQLPGNPVIMNEITGEVYAGETGLRELLNRVVEGEFLPPKPQEQKGPEKNVWTNMSVA